MSALAGRRASDLLSSFLSAQSGCRD